MISTFWSLPWKRALTSVKRGSPTAPGSLVRSRTAMRRTLFGRTEKKYFSENGR